MRIDRVEIDGFGRFSAAAWELPAGLTVMHGRNEAGKTTLLNAIRAILFGFESTREGRTWYPALAGGRRGGRLQLLTASGERWRVERHGERGGAGALVVTAPNGNQGGQETLDRLLHGADRDLFANIFAFGLGELQHFTSLSSAGVRSRIYGAGSGLGGMSAIDVERRLRAEQERSFLPGGRQQQINRLLGEVEELRGRIADLERIPAEHEALRAERSALDQRRGELQARRRAATELREHLRRLREAQPVAAALQILRTELAAMDPTLERLPADAEAILERRLDQVEVARQAIADIASRTAATDRELDQLQVDEALLAAGAELTALRDERLIQEQRGEDRRHAEASAARHAAEVEDQLRRVGGWPEPRLLAVDDSIAALEETREAERRLAATVGQVERAAAAAAAARGELTLLEQEAGAADGDEAELHARRDALTRLAELGLGARSGVPGASRRSSAANGMVVGGVALLTGATVLGVAAAVFGNLAMGVVLGLLAMLAILAISRLIPSAPALSPDAQLIQTADSDRQQLLARAGLPESVGPSQIAARLEETARELAAVGAERQRQARFVERGRTQARLEAELAEAQRAHAAELDVWGDWLKRTGLEPSSSPETARQLLAAAGLARRAAAARDEQRHRAAEIEAASDAYEQRLDARLERLGRNPAPDSRLRPAVLAQLLQELERATDARRREEELRRALAELTVRAEEARAAMSTAEAALAGWLESSGAADPDDLRARAGQAQLLRNLQQQVRELRNRLAGIAGSEAAVVSLIAEAGAEDPAALEVRAQEAAAEVDRLEAEESSVVARIGELGARLTQLESTEELGVVRQQLAVAEARLAEASRQWSIRAVALALLAETRKRYERDRQPQVVQDAERYFAEITDGRYPRIVAAPGEESVRVEPAEGAAKELDELSRGTQEQLYLALRFGLIEQFARGAEGLPVVMDDILVNFDADRAARAASAIRDLAARHQVLYFTCHAWTAELLDPDRSRTVALG